MPNDEFCLMIEWLMSLSMEKLIQWPNLAKTGEVEYVESMDVLGLSLIRRICVLIFFPRVLGFNLRSWVESRHIRSFGELGRAR